MDFNFRPEKILSLTGYLIAFTGIIYFLFTYVPQLTTGTKAVLLFSLFVFFLLLSLGVPKEKKIRTLLSLLTASISYLLFLGYLLTNLSLEQNQVFMLIMLSSGLLIGISYLLKTDRLDISRDTAKKAIIALSVLVVALLAYDIAVNPETSIQTFDDIQVSQGEYLKVADITATNNFIFPEEVEEPYYEACVPGLNSDVESRYQLGTVDGLDTEKYSFEVRFDDFGDFNVEKTDSCPEDGELATLYIYPTDGFEDVSFTFS